MNLSRTRRNRQALEHRLRQRRDVQRRGFFEPLEPRILLASDFPNLLPTAPGGGLVYENSTAATLDAVSEIDSYLLNLDGGQALSLMLTTSSGALQTRVTLLGPDGAALNEVDATGVGQTLIVPLTATDEGVHTIDVTSLAGTGEYELTAIVNADLESEYAGGSLDALADAQVIDDTPTQLPGGGERFAVHGQADVAGDYFVFQMTANDVATLTLTLVDPDAEGDLELKVYNDAGTLLAQGLSLSNSAEQHVVEFVASDGGAYYARVGGTAGVAYGLTVTRNASFDLELHSRGDVFQDITRNGEVLAGLRGRGGSGGGGTTRVAVVGTTGNSSDNAGFQQIVDQLNDSAQFGFQAQLVTAVDVDTAAELDQYDVVVIGNNGYSTGDEFSVVAPVLKPWVESGGGLLMTGWGIYGSGNETTSTRTALNDILPVYVLGGYSYSSSGTVTPVDVDHPVIEGVASFAATGNYVEYPATNPRVNPGSTILGTTAGQPSVVVREPDSGRTVYLGPIYSGYSGYNLTSLRGGEADQLLEQAVDWLGGNTDSEDIFEFKAT